jgi:hypothetical protein
LGREVARWATGGGEQSSAAALGVRGARGEVEVGAALYRLGKERETVGEARNGHRGGEEEAVPNVGGERRRRPSSIRSSAEEVARGARRRAVWWRRPREVAVRRPKEGETPGERWSGP